MATSFIYSHIRQGVPAFAPEKRKFWTVVALIRGSDGRTAATISKRPEENDFVATMGTREDLVLNTSDDFGKLMAHAWYAVQKHRVSPRARDLVDKAVYLAVSAAQDEVAGVSPKVKRDKEFEVAKEALIDYIAELEDMLPQHADAKS